MRCRTNVSNGSISEVQEEKKHTRKRHLKMKCRMKKIQFRKNRTNETAQGEFFYMQSDSEPTELHECMLCKIMVSRCVGKSGAERKKNTNEHEMLVLKSLETMSTTLSMVLEKQNRKHRSRIMREPKVSRFPCARCARREKLLLISFSFIARSIWAGRLDGKVNERRW